MPPLTHGEILRLRDATELNNDGMMAHDAQCMMRHCANANGAMAKIIV